MCAPTAGPIRVTLMKKPISQQQAETRNGAILVVVTMMIFVLIVVSALTVDVAFMQMVRTDLRIATDAATKASVEALVRTEDKDEARAVAVQIASRHTVGGRPFSISPNDLTFGRLEVDALGESVFVPDAEPPNSVRIATGIGGTAASPGLPLFFASALGHSDFETQQAATATRRTVDVVLALDRSGSMNFDTTGTDWAYPPNNPRLSGFTPWGWTWRNYVSPPHPEDSRWAALVGAVDVFVEEAAEYNPAPRLGLVTWASEYTMPGAAHSFVNRTFFPTTEIDVALPGRFSNDWAKNSTDVLNALEARSNGPVCGGTNLSAGLDEALAILGNAESELSEKVVILLTDGQWNQGRNPIQAANDAAAMGIKVHCVSMNGGSAFTCGQIATITGGKFFNTANTQQLREAFRELARSLPVTLVE